MTNFEKIKQMSVEEMAEAIYEKSDNCENYCVCVINGRCSSMGGNKRNCISYIQEYLEKEVEE